MSQFLIEGFEFINFVPTTKVASRAVEKLSHIFSESPSDSSTKAWLKKDGALFEGRLQIRSAVGNFVAEVIGEDPIQVINALTTRIRSQLGDWKRGRLLI